jgi:hypothetical protein
MAIPKGYRTMLATHDKVTRQMRRRLKTTCIGLGHVQLLQDAKRFDEARTTLYSLENDFQEPSQNPVKGVSKTASSSSASVSPRLDTAEALTMPSSIA